MEYLLVALAFAAVQPKKFSCDFHKQFWSRHGKHFDAKTLKELFLPKREAHRTANSIFYKAAYAGNPVFVQKLSYAGTIGKNAAQRHLGLTYDLQETGSVPRLIACLDEDNFLALVVEPFERTLKEGVSWLSGELTLNKMNGYIGMTEAVSTLHNAQVVLNLSDMRTLAFADQMCTKTLILDFTETCDANEPCPLRNSLFSRPQRLRLQSAALKWDVYSLGVLLAMVEMKDQGQKLAEASKDIAVEKRALSNYQKFVPEEFKPMTDIIKYALSLDNFPSTSSLLNRLTKLRQNFLKALNELAQKRSASGAKRSKKRGKRLDPFMPRISEGSISTLNIAA